ncbi:MAG: hypothetical protein LBR98_03635, partial [Syntrophomonadaceae bacterium]|nr:hypothetical protein [Syntrophomonadaceae bacterium]
MPGTQSGGDGEAAGFAGRGSRNRWEAARKPVKARNAPQTKTANELGSVVLCKRDMVKTQRPEDITGAHRATAQAGVTGQPPRAL